MVRFRWTTLCLVGLLGLCVDLAASDYAIGADVSFLRALENGGKVLKESGQPKAGLAILKDHGYTWVRLRLFHTPADLPNNLEYTLASAKAAKQLGFHILLDLHYSDTWADPGKQFTPKIWEGLSHAQLRSAVFEYSKATIAVFKNAGVLPEMVQVGNEVINGMLWPDGRLPDRWDNFADLIQAGVAGVEAGASGGPEPRIMIHIDRGGDRAGTKAFFDKLNSYHVKCDVIGQSYYPWWHGSLNDLRENLIFMAQEYKKDIVLVETAYHWQPSEYIAKPGPFAETPDGQLQFLEEVNRVVQQTPNGLGKGVFWWEPAATGPLGSRSFFDDDGNALPVVRAFDSLTRF